MNDKLEEMFKRQHGLNSGYFSKLGLGTTPKDLWEKFDNIDPNQGGPVLFNGISFDSYESVSQYMSKKDSNPAKWVREYTRAMVHECLEIDAAAKYKFWDHDESVDFDEVAREIIDVWHFLISVTQCAGISPDKLFELYTKKLRVNETRRDSGKYSTNNKKGKHPDDAHITLR